MKKILNILTFSLVFATCPDGFYEDDCGTCWMPYCYNTLTHDISYDLNEDTCIQESSIWIIPGSEEDPYFNSYCNGSCPENFLADQCNSCWSSFCYTFFSPGLDGDPTHSVYYDLNIEECENYGFNYYQPDHPSNPYWNSNCSYDCNNIINGDAMVDECGDCQSAYCYDYVTHQVSFGACDGATQMWVEANSPSNPYWNASCACLEGDFNQDNILNITDIVGLVNHIISDSEYNECLDFTGEGIINIVDVVAVVNYVLGGNALTSISPTEAVIEMADGQLSVRGVDGTVDGIQLTLSHGSDFSIDLVDVNGIAIAAKNSIDNNTTIVVVAQKDLSFIGTTTGDYQIVDHVVAATDRGEAVEVEASVAIEIVDFKLSPAYPNPFNPTTNLELAIPEAGYVSVKVYNLVGQEVATLVDGMMDANPSYTFQWNAGSLSSGVYLVRAEGAGQMATQKLMLLK